MKKKVLKVTDKSILVVSVDSATVSRASQLRDQLRAIHKDAAILIVPKAINISIAKVSTLKSLRNDIDRLIDVLLHNEKKE